MATLNVFNFMSLDGYYKGVSEDISWHKQGTGPEEAQFAEEGAKSESILLFGRVTYQMMASFWPTPQAFKAMPGVAEGMNRSEKVVVSRTLKTADWNNTRILHGDLGQEIGKLKASAKHPITILGSGSLITQLADLGLIDSYQFMLDPIAIGKGTPIFHGLKRPIHLTLVGTRVFRSGTIVLTYKPQAHE
ncbi:MAG: dihydrofolate reductase family protein [Bacteroidota bacterium]|nr:dihydrofolate reductase family protein [Bacteroidota bacterium]